MTAKYIDDHSVLGVSYFALAVIFALVGQFIAYGALDLLAGAVDFAKADPAHSTPTLVLGLTLFAQIILLALGLSKSGFTAMRAAVGTGAIIFSFAMLLLLWVALQCVLYNACL